MAKKRKSTPKLQGTGKRTSKKKLGTPKALTTKRKASTTVEGNKAVKALAAERLRGKSTDDSPVAILERLLAQKPGPQNAHYLKASRDFFERDWTYEEVAAIEAEFARDFRETAARVEAVWGPPEFIGHRTKSKFPEFYTAEEFCYWRKGDRLAMIWWEHQDKEVPVLLTLAVLRPEEIAD